jgi:hypothetical protein
MRRFCDTTLRGNQAFLPSQRSASRSGDSPGSEPPSPSPEGSCSQGVPLAEEERGQEPDRGAQHAQNRYTGRRRGDEGRPVKAPESKVVAITRGAHSRTGWGVGPTGTSRTTRARAGRRATGQRDEAAMSVKWGLLSA